jgi:MOSC domain-containing protein YiiM
MSMSPHVVAVARSARHTFSKDTETAIRLLAGLGVEGDAHAGETVKHRSRVAADPTQPNLRQVHLVHAELFEELGERGFAVAPGDIGENVTTRGLALLALPTGTRLHLGGTAVVEVTGLRNPCAQLDSFSPASWPPCSTATQRDASCARPGSWAWCWWAARCGPAIRSA